MAEQLQFGLQTFSGTPVYQSNFESLDDFWWEGTPDVTAAGGVLRVKAALDRHPQKHHVSTVFVKRPFEGNLLVEFEAQSAHEKSHRNFNFFIHTKLRDGRDLYATRGERTGDYPEYHVMDNYLFTFLASRVESEGPDAPEFSRWRFRRDPGFRLMKEVYSFPIEQFRWYRFQYVVKAGLIGCSVDRRVLDTYGWEDPAPLPGGHLGFRTFCSHMEYRGLKIWQLA